MTADAGFVLRQRLNAPATPTAEGNALAGQCQVQRCIGVSVCPKLVFVGASRRPQRAGDFERCTPLGNAL